MTQRMSQVVDATSRFTGIALLVKFVLRSLWYVQYVDGDRCRMYFGVLNFKFLHLKVNNRFYSVDFFFFERVEDEISIKSWVPEWCCAGHVILSKHI